MGFPVDKAADGLMDVEPEWPGEPVRRRSKVMRGYENTGIAH